MENNSDTILILSKQEKIYCLLKNCKKSFQSPYELIMHFNQEHSLFFFCKCSYLFKSRADLCNHQFYQCNKLSRKSLSLHTIKTRSKKKVAQSFCPCNQTTAKTAAGLAAHIDSYHYSLQSEKFICYTCSMEFSFSSDVVQHLSQKHNLFEIKNNQLLPPIKQFLNANEINKIAV